jgi:hypothetical protein
MSESDTLRDSKVDEEEASVSGSNGRLRKWRRRRMRLRLRRRMRRKRRRGERRWSRIQQVCTCDI